MRRFLLKLLRRGRLQEDLEKELAFHREMSGANQNPIPFGNTGLIKERALDLWRFTLIEDLGRDLLYALQAIRHTPLFSVAAILMLALGIGVNTFIFTFIDNFLLRSLPASNPEQLVTLNWGEGSNMSYPNYVSLREQNSAFSELVASRVNIVNAALPSGNNLLTWGYESTGNYFEALGIQPQLGRFFTPAEDKAPGANPVVVISDRYWRGHFSADPSVVGQVVKLNGYAFTVIGVAPGAFTGTELIMSCDFWVPMSMELQIEPGNDWYHSRTASNIWVMGRLKPGVTVARAAANLNEVGQQLAVSYPKDIDPRAKFHLSRPGLIGSALRKPMTEFAAVFAGLAGMVLLLACVNLAGMLLAKASDRHREIGIRLALGAGKWRLLRQLMTESALLSGAAGVVGFATSVAGCRLFSLWRPDLGIPFNTTLAPDFRVLCFAGIIAFLSAFVFGLVPALQAIRTDIVPNLKEDLVAAKFRGFNTRDLLVVGQVALSVLLVIASALVVRSLQNALSLKLGYTPERAVSISFDQRLKDYSSEKSRQFSSALLQRVSALPGFEAVGITSNLPLRLDHGNNNIINRADRPVPALSDLHAATIYNISPGYFRAAGTELLSGRDFDSRDRMGTPPVAIVNEALVRLLFPGENSIGQHVRLSPNSADKGLEIIGIVETGKYEYLGEDPHPAVFVPISQTGIEWTTLVARGPLPPPQALDLLRKAVLALNPELAISNAGSLKEQLALPLLPARIAAIILGLFGLLALVLAAAGLFALVAYTVARRSREIGIRMALGARGGQVLAVVLRRTLALSAIGIVLGAGFTLFAGQILSSILYGITPRDPIAWAAAILTMTVVALVACFGPASRAIRTNPALTLRRE